MHGDKNSFPSYLHRIHFSFSSRDDVDDGFVRPSVADSHTELAKLLPIANITAMCPALNKKKVEN